VPPVTLIALFPHLCRSCWNHLHANVLIWVFFSFRFPLVIFSPFRYPPSRAFPPEASKKFFSSSHLRRLSLQMRVSFRVLFQHFSVFPPTTTRNTFVVSPVFSVFFYRTYFLPGRANRGIDRDLSFLVLSQNFSVLL